MKKAKAKKWDALQVKMESIIQNKILGELNICKSYIRRWDERGVGYERISVQNRDEFERGYKAACDYNSITYNP